MKFLSKIIGREIIVGVLYVIEHGFFVFKGIYPL
jgi:hypothetical protein